MTERERLEQAIAALEAQRATLGDVVVDTMIAAARKELNALEPALTEQQRKQVTVLFADVSGFTAMSEALDAEEVSDVMNALWQQLDAVIVEHGGAIDKHMGDAVMALWRLWTWIVSSASLIWFEFTVKPTHESSAATMMTRAVWTSKGRGSDAS